MSVQNQPKPTHQVTYNIKKKWLITFLILIFIIFVTLVSFIIYQSRINRHFKIARNQMSFLRDQIKEIQYQKYQKGKKDKADIKREIFNQLNIFYEIKRQSDLKLNRIQMQLDDLKDHMDSQTLQLHKLVLSKDKSTSEITENIKTYFTSMTAKTQQIASNIENALQELFSEKHQNKQNNKEKQLQKKQWKQLLQKFFNESFQTSKQKMEDVKQYFKDLSEEKNGEPPKYKKWGKEIGDSVKNVWKKGVSQFKSWTDFVDDL